LAGGNGTNGPAGLGGIVVLTGFPENDWAAVIALFVAYGPNPNADKPTKSVGSA